MRGEIVQPKVKHLCAIFGLRRRASCGCLHAELMTAGDATRGGKTD